MSRMASGAALAILILAAGCAGHQTAGTPGGNIAPPVITQTYASPELRPGDTWKVYLTAEDPQGEMKYIVCEIFQPGVGPYPVSRTRIRKENQHHLNGYVFLNTFPTPKLNFVNLTLKLQIQDRPGHFSQPAELPVSLNPTYRQIPPPPGIFQENNLGPIMIDVSGVGEREILPPFINPLR